MIKKIEHYSEIFENSRELVKEICDLFLDVIDVKIFSNQQDKIALIIDEILHSYNKDLQNELIKRHQGAINLTKTMLALNDEDNQTRLFLDQKVQLLITCRRVLTEKISRTNYEIVVKKKVQNSVLNITDLSILALYKKNETERRSKIRRDMHVIDNLKVVKNDLQKKLNLTYQIIKNTPIALAEFNSELKIKIWNSVAENLTGYKQSEIIGKSILNIFTIPSQSVIRRQLSHELHRRKRMKLNIQTKEGGTFNAYVLISKLKSEMKEEVQYIINIVDLSKDEQLKAQFEKIEQLGAIARLSDAILHDVRNPINALALNIDVLTQLLSGKSTIRKDISDIIEKINRQLSYLSYNLNQYVGYSRITELKLEPIDLREPLDELILDTRDQFAQRQILLKYHRSKNRLMINGDRNQLIRVFRNLINNAIDAIESRGNIELSVRKRNKNIIISIVDDGSGIKPENLQNVFKSYFTTKEKGSGLGLFIVREIVRAHRGRIYCSSSDKQGTRFTVSIPAIVDQKINH